MRLLHACVLSTAAIGLCAQPTAAEEKAAAPVYELRTYTTAEGKLPALHKRFREHTMKLFAKHGMKNVMYFTPVDKKNTLVYLLEHKSRDAADKSWQAFVDDKQWQKAYTESRKDGSIVVRVQRQFLKATDYSPKK